MTLGTRGPLGIRSSGGGASLPAWGALPAGSEGDVTAVNVEGEICVAERGPFIWALRGPSASAQSYAIANPMPSGSLQPAYRVIASGLAASFTTGANAKCWAIRIVNTTGKPVTTIRIGGRNTGSSHAQIQGLWAIGGTINNATFQGTTWERFSIGGSSTYTPPNGTTTIPTFWVTDTLTLATPLAPGASMVLRAQTAAGNVSGILSWTSLARPNSGDAPSLGMSADGDYGSSLATVQTNPASWNTGTTGFIGFIELGYMSEQAEPIAMSFGDSVIAGFTGGPPSRDRWTATAKAGFPAGQIVSLGADGQTTVQSCQTAVACVSSGWAANARTVTLPVWSWNNADSNFTSWQTTLQNAIMALQNAGKRVVLWIPVPSGRVSGGYGNPTTWAQSRAWAQASGLPLIESWPAVAEGGGVGPLIDAAYTTDGAHLTDSGQIVQGTSMGTQELILFP